MFKRAVQFDESLQDMSILLLGPRQTGKSTLIHDRYSRQATVLDLLNPELFRDLQKSPNTLIEIVNASPHSLIVIDEIQKIPELLDVVHLIIEKEEKEKKKKIRFLLTGSSARKIRQRGANLLGGRAFPITLHPICSKEYLQNDPNANIQTLIELGGLPKVLTSKKPQNLLKAYVGVYLQEEIKAEGYVRNLGDFSKFLDVAALTNAEQLDFAGVARDAQLSSRTIASYYQILQDTLTGYLLSPYRKTKTRKAVATPKFYFFDTGIANHLSGRESLALGTPEYGKAFEHFLFTELIAYRDYSNLSFEIFYWRSTSKMEVDFILKTKKGQIIAIEAKGSQRVNPTDEKGIHAFEEEVKLSQKIIVCNETIARTTKNQIQIIPLRVFCERLWSHKIID